MELVRIQQEMKDESMEIFKQFFNNTRKPNGWMGKIMVNSMNEGHVAVSA